MVYAPNKEDADRILKAFGCRKMPCRKYNCNGRRGRQRRHSLFLDKSFPLRSSPARRNDHSRAGGRTLRLISFPRFTRNPSDVEVLDIRIITRSCMKKIPKPKSVEAYIAAAPRAVQPNLKELRAVIRKTAPD